MEMPFLVAAYALLAVISGQSLWTFYRTIASLYQTRNIFVLEERCMLSAPEIKHKLDV